MRNPGRKALYCALALLAAAGLIRLGIQRHEPTGGDWSATGPIMLGLAIAPFALYLLIEALLAARGSALLRAGVGVIARWHVPPAEWDRFRGIDRRRAGSGPERVNELRIRTSTLPRGAEVIVGETSLIIDGSYHLLRPGGLPELRGVAWIEGPPACLEFTLRYPRGRYGGTVTSTLRIPVPDGARGSAVRVFEHFDARCRPRPSIALREPRRTYRVCAGLVAGAAAAAALAYAALRDLPEERMALAWLSLLIGAAVLAIFAIILGIATFLLTRR